MDKCIIIEYFDYQTIKLNYSIHDLDKPTIYNSFEDCDCEPKVEDVLFFIDKNNCIKGNYTLYNATIYLKCRKFVFGQESFEGESIKSFEKKVNDLFPVCGIQYVEGEEIVIRTGKMINSSNRVVSKI
jgi:hypothetical protein